MDVVATVEVPVTCDRLFSFVSDLSNYESWLEMVHSVNRLEDKSNDNNPGWLVELQARLGPFARSKRLRMVRTVYNAPNVVVFERVEQDSRRHSEWILRASISETSNGSSLETNLHYSGSLFTGGLLERALSDQIEHGRERLMGLLIST